MDHSVSLQRWQQAFEDYPISTTRILEKQLRSSISSNRDRLRSLVGGNYRELLSTADKIVYLDGRTKAIEQRVSELGRQCVPPPRTQKPSVSSNSQLISELSLLHKCLDTTRQVLHIADHLRAAQLIVIARLLQKSLQQFDATPSSLSTLQDATLSLRRQCISRINASFTNPRAGVKTVVRAACAYCLITSASASEVFQYTLRLRLERLKVVASWDSTTADSSCNILRYILVTINTVRRAFGRPLVDALSNLQKRLVLQDLDLVASGVVASNETLQLISEDVRSFSPYFKRESVTTVEASERLASWTAEACDILKQTLQKQASRSTQSSEVIALRRALLTILLPSYFSSDAGDLIRDKISEPLSKRLLELAATSARGLQGIVDNFASRPSSTTPTMDLWNHELASMSLEGGSDTFLSQVHKHYLGQTTFLSSMSRKLNNWIITTQAAVTDLEKAKSVRWRDLLEEPSDEQEDLAAELIKTLSEIELDQMISKLKELTKDAISATEARLVESVKAILEERSEVSRAVYQVRVIRIVLNPIRQAFPEEASLVALEDSIPALHEMISQGVVSQTLATDNASLGSELHTVVDGLPSPAAFILLQRLCETMYSTGGSDLWSPAAVQKVKRTLRGELFPTDDTKNEKWSAFDQAFLACALDGSIGATPDSDVAKDAKDYWHRTRLLFGILAEHLA